MPRSFLHVAASSLLTVRGLLSSTARKHESVVRPYRANRRAPTHSIFPYPKPSPRISVHRTRLKKESNSRGSSSRHSEEVFREHMFLYLRSRSGRRYYILLLKFLSFFSFTTRSPRWLYRQGTFLAQMVGYRCNFKNWVQNFWGDPPLKFGGPKPPRL